MSKKRYEYTLHCCNQQNNTINIKTLTMQSCFFIFLPTTFIFNLLCMCVCVWGHAAVYHITFPEHHIPLRVIKFSHIFFLSSKGKVHQSCHPSDPIRSDRSLYSSATFTLHVRMSLRNNPYSFPFILNGGGASATPAIRQPIYLTWKLMITKDS